MQMHQTISLTQGLTTISLGMQSPQQSPSPPPSFIFIKRVSLGHTKKIRAQRHRYAEISNLKGSTGGGVEEAGNDSTAGISHLDLLRRLLFPAVESVARIG